MKTTVRSIAEEVGVSPATVSRVFSGAARVSPEVRQKVLSVAMRNGYGAEEARNIAVVLPSSALLGYCTLLLKQLFIVLAAKGFRCMVMRIDDIALMDESVLSGAISLAYKNELGRIWNRKQGIPLVCINALGSPIDGIREVRSDDRQGINLAMNYLYRYGHRRLALLTYDSDPYLSRSATDRRKVFEEFLGSHPDCSGVARNCSFLGRFLDVTQELIRTGATALLATGESLGGPVTHLLLACGIRIPQDLSFIAFENPECTPHLTPAPTTLEQRFDGLAAAAVDLLEKQLRGDHAHCKDVLVNYNLIERDSVAQPSS